MEGRTIRCDDLESLPFVLMYFFRGALLWQSLSAATKKQKYVQIMEKIAVMASQTNLAS